MSASTASFRILRRLALAGLWLAPTLAAAQSSLRIDIGLASTGPSEPYQEVSVSASAPVTGVVIVGATVAQASKLYHVDYGAPYPGSDIDPGFWGRPVSVERWTSLAVGGGVRLGSERASVQATAGPVLSIADLGGGDVLVGGGVGAEVGLVDVYPVPSIGLGLTLHGATTTSHTWAGVRLGARVRL